MQRIIPCLEQEFINPDMIPFVLPNMFLISDLSEPDEYVKYIFPKLKPIFKLQKPIQVNLRFDYYIKYIIIYSLSFFSFKKDFINYST